MDTDTSNSIWDSKKSSDKGTNIMLPGPLRWCIMYADASDNTCRTQLFQEHDGQEFPVMSSCTHHRNSRKMEHPWTRSLWSILCHNQVNTTSKVQIYMVRNDHKLLPKFLNGKNANNKVNHWSLELATYNIIFEWISGGCNKQWTGCQDWWKSQRMIQQTPASS